jgi:hypothetical protein
MLDDYLPIPFIELEKKTINHSLDISFQSGYVETLNQEGLTRMGRCRIAVII